MALRHIKKEGKKKKREEGKVRKLGYNLNFKNTILALVCECFQFGDSMVLTTGDTQSP